MWPTSQAPSSDGPYSATLGPISVPHDHYTNGITDLLPQSIHHTTGWY